MALRIGEGLLFFTLTLNMEIKGVRSSSTMVVALMEFPRVVYPAWAKSLFHTLNPIVCPGLMMNS